MRRGYAGLSKPEKWVDHAPLSELAGQYAAERREAYRLLVESGLAEDDEELKEVLKRSRKAVGGWKFCRQVETLYLLLSGTITNGGSLVKIDPGTLILAGTCQVQRQHTAPHLH